MGSQLSLCFRWFSEEFVDVGFCWIEGEDGGMYQWGGTNAGTCVSKIESKSLAGLVRIKEDGIHRLPLLRAHTNTMK